MQLSFLTFVLGPLASPTLGPTESLERLPLVFEENRGQAAAGTRFLTQGRGYALGLTDDGPIFAIAGGGVLRISLDGARPTRPEAIERLPGVVSYLRGADRSRWVRSAPTFARVVYANLLPGVDWEFYEAPGAGRTLEFDLRVAPGSDPQELTLVYDGADRVELDPSGSLRIHVGGAVLEQRPPVVHQDLSGMRSPVAASYAKRGAIDVGFDLGAYDASRPLIIDPVVAHSTFLGGDGFDTPTGVHVDEAGAIYFGGSTNSTDLPVVAAFQPFYAGSAGADDFWAAKLDPSGATLLYLTYIGGVGLDRCQDFAVDGEGRAVLVGSTDVDDFPQSGGLQTYGGLTDAVAMKLNAAGDGLVFSTYLGGFGPDRAMGTAIGTAGDVFVTGEASAADFPVTPGVFQEVKGASFDGFVTRLAPEGAMVYSTFFGATGNDSSNAIAVSGESAWILGDSTDGASLPQAGGAFAGGPLGLNDVFVARFDPAGGLEFAQAIGGSLNESANNGALDSRSIDEVVLAFGSASPDFPTTAGALEELKAPGGSQGVILHIDLAEAPALQLATFWGDERTGALARDVKAAADGTIWVGGVSALGSFPLVDEIIGNTNPFSDGLLTQIAADGSSFLFSTFLGATTDVTALVLGGGALGHDVYVAGTTGAPLFAGVPPDVSLGSLSVTSNAFVARIDPDCEPPASYGAGSAGSGGFVPAIRAVGLPRVGALDFAIQGNELVGGALVLQAASLGQAVLPALGVTLLIDPTLIFLQATSGADGNPGDAGVGTVTFPAPVPNLANLVGLGVNVQHLVVDAAGPAGFAASPGLNFEICPAL